MSAYTRHCFPSIYMSNSKFSQDNHSNNWGKPPRSPFAPSTDRCATRQCRGGLFNPGFPACLLWLSWGMGRREGEAELRPGWPEASVLCWEEGGVRAVRLLQVCSLVSRCLPVVTMHNILGLQVFISCPVGNSQACTSFGNPRARHNRC